MKDVKELERIVAAYKRFSTTPECELIIKDLRAFSMIDKQAGSSLTHEECAYRNALQDFYRYIEAMISGD